jgi:hypothetical protein
MRSMRLADLLALILALALILTGAGYLAGSLSR